MLDAAMPTRTLCCLLALSGWKSRHQALPLAARGSGLHWLHGKRHGQSKKQDENLGPQAHLTKVI